MRKGFTLAEIIITLGIIGVVAAMTMPSLIGEINKRTIEARLKEDYSIIQQVMKKAEASDSFTVDIPDNLSGSKKWFDSIIAPNMKYGNVCFNTSGCWHSNNTYTLLGSRALYDNPNIGIGYNIIVINMLNGSTIVIDGYGRNDMKNLFGVDNELATSVVVFIDANGKKPPNVIGKDIYAAVYTPEGLVPAGNDRTAEEVNANCSINTSRNNAGYYCLRKMMMNGWKMPAGVWTR